ncbi:hypothetical protein AB0C40_03240 [Streptomyces brevispora]|uniref:hypothetical protein n=1 Tax=Streptomyces brevispora TaxID=887462 RepID=UPI0033E329D5
MSEWAALISAVTAVLGLLLGFFGLPTVVNSPTAKPVRETVTVTATPPPENRGPATEPADTPSPTPQQDRGSLIEDVLPMTSDADDTKRSFTAGALTVNNRSYPRTLYGFDAERTWQLDRKYNTLVTAIGVSDSTPSGYGVVFTVRVDGDTVKEFTIGRHPRGLSCHARRARVLHQVGRLRRVDRPHRHEIAPHPADAPLRPLPPPRPLLLLCLLLPVPGMPFGAVRAGALLHRRGYG